MKLKYSKKIPYKLIKYNILKSKIYLQTKSKKMLNKNMEQFEINLKQMLKLIYEYHFNNKLIYFIDFPFCNTSGLLQNIKKTNHKFFSKKMLSKKIKNKTIIEPQLIVVFIEEFNSLDLNNFIRLNVPIILVNSLSFFDFFVKKKIQII